ncbi:MAG: N-acetylmuramidase family protein [Microcystis aeruginosa LL13-06]|jgi:hypothetical protein|nr:N-acetylmuramidase family protein [Microcystis aeruginosa LL13-06]NCS37186.1 N-acetylmuramidase family protein [Microcystis aeruginosa G11-01]
MRPVPSGVEYIYPPVSYSDGRKSIVKIPAGYVQPALSDQDYKDLSSEFDLEIPMIRAVMEVESAGSGFLLSEPAPARPKILFEAHWFYQLTPKPVSQTRPDLSSPTWNKSLYKGGSAEWGRLLDAMQFDEIQALKSASYGLGQVMGFNYTVAGCSSIKQFIQENFAGEYWQARHMMNFIVNNGLKDELKRQDWAGFALGYNGSGYRANRYDTKLANAYHRSLSA